MKDDILKLISVTKNSILMKTLKDELTAAEDLDLQKIRLLSDLTSESGNLLFPNEVSSDMTLMSNRTYFLQGRCIVRPGATLTIKEGTMIEVLFLSEELIDNSYILVLPGGKINIEGNSSNPVVMYSNRKLSGSWGGLIIAGKSNVYDDMGNLQYDKKYQGFVYGGNIEDDNSGMIKNLIIKHAGFKNEDNCSLSLYGVGRDTILENIIIYDSRSCLRIFGGNVSLNNFYSVDCNKDAIFWDEGYSGYLNDIYIEHNKDFNSVISANGFNMNPKINNLYAISTMDEGDALHFNDSSGTNIDELTLLGYDMDFVKSDSNSVIIEGVTVPNPTGNPATMIDQQLVILSRLDNHDDKFFIPENPKGDLILHTGIRYGMKNKCVIKPNYNLIMEKGVMVEIQTKDIYNSDEVYFLIENGGKVIIEGTEDEPVVLYSDRGKPGSWGGMVILGSAPVTNNINDFDFGGDNISHNGGIINHLIIKDTGTSDNSLGGINLYGVGHGTNISNLAIINGSSNGVNIYGGKTTMINLFIKDCYKNSIYFTNGYDGTLTNIYLYHTIFGNNIAMTGDENDKIPTFNNLTGNSQVGGVGLIFKKDIGANINGLSLLGYDDEEILESNNVITKNNIASSTELEDFKWANMFLNN